jgi:hypothetical protein
MRDRPSDQHRVVAQARPGEIVHHRDENKANNSPANLEKTTRGAHTAAHNKTRNISGLRKSLRMYQEGRKLY